MSGAALLAAPFRQSKGVVRIDPAIAIGERQRAWARIRAARLIGSKGERGERAYTDSVEGNLFEPLSPEARDEYGHGDGGELGKGGDPGKMQAVHSSSALSCNVFHYWRRIGQPDVIAKGCGLPTGVQSIAFEKHLEIDAAQFRRAPNLDAVLTYRDRLIAVESKFCEPFSNRKAGLLSTAYLASSCDAFWAGLSNLRALAEKLTTGYGGFAHLHAPQLVKHILGLRKQGGTASALLYLYYAVPGEAGTAHAAEVERFIGIARADGVPMFSTTYQHVILRLLRDNTVLKSVDREPHLRYLDYVASRYL